MVLAVFWGFVPLFFSLMAPKLPLKNLPRFCHFSVLFVRFFLYQSYFSVLLCFSLSPLQCVFSHPSLHPGLFSPSIGTLWGVGEGVVWCWVFLRVWGKIVTLLEMVVVMMFCYDCYYYRYYYYYCYYYSHFCYYYQWFQVGTEEEERVFSLMTTTKMVVVMIMLCPIMAMIMMLLVLIMIPKDLDLQKELGRRH